MRKLALAAAVVGFGMTLAGAASARVWTDPNGRVSFEAPTSWVMEVRVANPQTVVIAGNANNECYVFATPNASTANATPGAVRRVQALTPESWVATANSVRTMFPNQNAAVTSSSLDSVSGFWPIQRAELSGGERPVVAAIQSRLGLDLMAFCWTYAGADASATYETLFRSLANPNDAAWQQAAEAEPAQTATPTTQAEAPATEQPQRRQRRQRGITSGGSNNAAGGAPM